MQSKLKTKQPHAALQKSLYFGVIGFILSRSVIAARPEASVQECYSISCLNWEFPLRHFLAKHAACIRKRKDNTHLRVRRGQRGSCLRYVQ